MMKPGLRFLAVTVCALLAMGNPLHSDSAYEAPGIEILPLPGYRVEAISPHGEYICGSVGSSTIFLLAQDGRIFVHEVGPDDSLRVAGVTDQGVCFGSYYSRLEGGVSKGGFILRPGAEIEILDPGPHHTSFRPLAASESGEVLVGSAHESDWVPQAAMYVDGAIELLNAPEGSWASDARAVSADGRVVVGVAYKGEAILAVRWTVWLAGDPG